MTKMRVIHSISSLEKRAGGPSNSVSRLSECLGQATGIRSTICTLNTRHERVDTAADVRAFPVGLSARLGHSSHLKRFLQSEAANSQIIHNHGLWMMPNLYAAQASRGGASKAVISPRGTLAQWSLQQSRFKKRIMLGVGQRRALADAACFHATSEQEYRDIRAFGLQQPVIVLPNGIDVPQAAAPQQKLESKRRRTLLFLGRIHPQKGIDVLMEVWAQLAPRFPEWRLVICGPADAAYLDSVQARAAAMASRVMVIPGLYGEAKTRLLQDSDLFILPSETENFGIAVAEALAHGVPVIVSEGAPWSAVHDHHCGWWVKNESSHYQSALIYAMSRSAHELGAMGSRGREWMRREYDWQTISRHMLLSYQWLLGEGERPACVRLQ